METRDVDTRAVYRSFVSAVRFFYDHGPRLVLVSVAWFCCSLPVVTVGPSTLGAYAAVASLREGHTVDRGRVVATVRRHGLSAALLSGVPLAFAAVAALYARRYLLVGSTVALVLGVLATYAAVYAALVLVPTFAALADGEELEPAVRAAVRWTGRNAVGAVMVGMGTFLLFVVTGALTIGFVVVFGGLVAAFHLETLRGPPPKYEAADEGWSPYEGSRR
ncbi:hypothetical protein [Candidatus Halobonum tyrrellensis]|uniref:DUF624 domain-containing protein n=1 Tax=Candidatus Halobonum tyrrellensis G22 TaxID=1324957 RepID=V4HFA8_9EURY|nr:hypothetical protein [Candidatus Halobonum tyrrellensis]ESP89360.1 hypothetical protein K933_05061 [Candidatus Halobonum tyrrellensis G22]